MKNILLLTGVLAVALTATFAPNAVAAEVTMETCDADYAAMIKAAEDNRARSIDELERSLRFASSDDAAADISQQINRTWELEEAFRNQASNFYRDCVKHLKSGGS